MLLSDTYISNLKALDLLSISVALSVVCVFRTARAI